MTMPSGSALQQAGVLCSCQVCDPHALSRRSGSVLCRDCEEPICPACAVEMPSTDPEDHPVEFRCHTAEEAGKEDDGDDSDD